jgi:hypothetical protein
VTAPEEVVQWTPWVTVVCAHPRCGEKTTRQWPPGQPPPKYCNSRCAKRDSNRKNKIARKQRLAEGGEIGEIVEVVIKHCARPGCQRTGVRQYHTASETPPRYCSTWCARRDSLDRNEQQRQDRDEEHCEHPEKLAYPPTEGGIRRAANDAVRFEKYVYACRCLRFHLTSQRESVPPICVDLSRSRHERRAAWYEYLVPIAQRLRERRALRAARERS